MDDETWRLNDGDKHPAASRPSIQFAESTTIKSTLHLTFTFSLEIERSMRIVGREAEIASYKPTSQD
jgi:hypothetical protein